MMIPAFVLVEGKGKGFIMALISVIVPCFNESDVLPIFYESIQKVTEEMKPQAAFEFLFVDDGSSDGTLEILQGLAGRDERVKYVSFSRNFGKEAAMYAGMENSAGDFVVIMDADLQDPPSLLPEMYQYIISEEYDCVATRRVTRMGEPRMRSFFARCFYRLINKLSKTEIVDGARDYRMMTRQMIDSILSLKEYNRFSKGIFSWVGYRTKWLEYENIERAAGQTKWSFWKLFVYSLDGIVGFSTLPLALASLMGILFCFISFLLILWIILKTIIWGDPVAGYPSTLCVIFFIGGIQLFCIGILGQYLAKTYVESKRRPIYIVKKAKLG